MNCYAVLCFFVLTLGMLIPLSAQQAISNGIPESGSISGAADQASWQFSVGEGEAFSVLIFETAGGANFEPRLEVLDPAGRIIGSDTGAVGARLDLSAEVSGNYIARVVDNSLNASGSVSISLVLPAAPFTVGAGDQGGNLVSGQASTGVINRGEADHWTVDAARGDLIVFQISETSGGAEFAPRMDIYSPNGLIIASRLNTLSSRADIVTEVAGRYSVVVSDRDKTGAGNYNLLATKLPGSIDIPTNDEGGALVKGSPNTGVISLGDSDGWTFNGQIGNWVVFKITETAGGAMFSPLIELIDPNGQRRQVASDTVQARIGFQCDISGDYTLLVSGLNPSDIGNYSVEFLQFPELNPAPAGDEGGSLSATSQTSGTLPFGDMDVFTFDVSPGEVVSLSLTETAGAAVFRPQLELFAPSGGRIFSASDVTSVEFERAFDVSGQFQVLVSNDEGLGAGSYDISLSRSTFPLPSGNVLVNGRVQTGEISTAGEQDTWTFTANTGEGVYVSVGETVSGSSLRPFVRVFAPDGSFIDSDDSTEAGLVFVDAPSSGRYTVLVSDGNAGNNGTGGYRLHLGKTGGELAVSPGDEGGELVNGIINNAAIDLGDLDVWNFTANTGEGVYVSVGETVSGSSLRPFVRVFAPDGSFIDSDDSTEAGLVFVDAPSSGRYTVFVSDGNAGNNGTGGYRLHLGKTGGELAVSPGDEGGELVNGIINNAAIDLGDLDVWNFTANTGEGVYVSVGETVSGSSLRPFVRVFAPDGSFIDSDDSTEAGLVFVDAPSSGRYTVFVSDGNAGNNGTGGYRLHLGKTGGELAVSPGDEGGELVNGIINNAAIDLGDLDVWNFTANTGEGIYVSVGETVSGSSLRPFVRVFAPDGSFIDSDDSTEAGLIFVDAPSSGRYTVFVSDGNAGNNETGGYRLHLGKTGGELAVSPGDEGGELVNGIINNAAIDLGDLDVWNFTANTGEGVYVSVGETVSGSSLRPFVRVFAPDGSFIDSEDSVAASLVFVDAPSSGRYTVFVSDGNAGNNGTGGYRLNLTRLRTPIVIALDDEGGALSPSAQAVGEILRGDTDVWFFTATAGRPVSITMTELTGSGFSPGIRVFDPDGVFLGSRSGASDAIFSFTPTKTGLYQFIAIDNSFSGEGTYEISTSGIEATNLGEFLFTQGVSVNSGFLTLRWTDIFNEFGLEESPDLAPRSWALSESPVIFDGVEASVTVSIDSVIGKRFFRLRANGSN